jgi:hypothetical protein
LPTTFAFQTDDPTIAQQIMTLLSGGAAPVATPATTKPPREKPPAAAPVQTAPPAGVPPAAPPTATALPPPPTSMLPPGSTAITSAPPPPAPVPTPPPAPVAAAADPHTEYFNEHVRPHAQAFIAKFSAAQAKAYMKEHFGAENAKDVASDQWPRLIEALRAAVA